MLGFDGKDSENENMDYTVIRFDAWKNDFWNNAFEPFVASIMGQDIFDLDRDRKNAESLLKNLAVSAGIIAKGIVKRKVEDYIDPDSLDEAINKSAGSAKDFLLRDSKLFNDYQEFKRGIEDFKEALLRLVDDKRKIVILVDELDRCKPTFSIQLLEIVKHLFDMSGITFLFMIDIEQLSHSVKTVYGQGMDATGYLCRFFDYIARMPKPDIKAYIHNSFEGVELFDDCKSSDKDKFINFYYGMQLQTGEYLKAAGVQEDKLYVKRRGSSSQLQQYAGVTDDMNLNGILFAPDIKKWEEIKNMQYGHYIHQQLEMFNFVNADTR